MKLLKGIKLPTNVITNRFPAIPADPGRFSIYLVFQKKRLFQWCSYLHAKKISFKNALINMISCWIFKFSNNK